MPTNDAMLKKNDVAPLMLAACPTAEQKWQEHSNFHGPARDGIDYVGMGVFAHHVVECYEQNRISEVDAAFEAIEKLIVEGTEQVRSLAVIGFLEDVQNIASHAPHGYDVFEPHLRSTSKQNWNELVELWQGKDSLADVVRAEEQGKTN